MNEPRLPQSREGKDVADDRTVSARWAGGYQVDVDTGDFTVRVDEPAHVGGTDTGPQPTDLLLASVASCFVLSLAWAASKREIQVPAISVEVTGTYDGPRFSSIMIDVSMPVPDDVAQRLVESAERVCYVTNTLKRAPEITVRRSAAG
jgi:putative redox protein